MRSLWVWVGGSGQRKKNPFFSCPLPPTSLSQGYVGVTQVQVKAVPNSVSIKVCQAIPMKPCWLNLSFHGWSTDHLCVLLIWCFELCVVSIAACLWWYWIDVYRVLCPLLQLCSSFPCTSSHSHTEQTTASQHSISLRSLVMVSAQYHCLFGQSELISMMKCICIAAISLTGRMFGGRSSILTRRWMFAVVNYLCRLHGHLHASCASRTTMNGLQYDCI